jgi:hypothetical protein
MSASSRLPRLVGAAGTAWGVLLLVRGDQVWRRVEHRPPSEVEDLAIRTLGVRHLVQGVAQVVAPRATGTAVVAVDLVHAATMAALAAASPQRRRAALVTGSVALASAGLTRLSRAGHP